MLILQTSLRKVSGDVSVTLGTALYIVVSTRLTGGFNVVQTWRCRFWKISDLQMSLPSRLTKAILVTLTINIIENILKYRKKVVYFFISAFALNLIGYVEPYFLQIRIRTNFSLLCDNNVRISDTFLVVKKGVRKFHNTYFWLICTFL